MHGALRHAAVLACVLMIVACGGSGGGGNNDGEDTGANGDDDTAPVTRNDAVSVDKGSSVTIDVLANDSGIDGSLDVGSVTVTSVPAHGSTSVDSSTGAITYSPDPDFSGTDSFGYTVDDDSGATSNVATVEVTVEPISAGNGDDDGGSDGEGGNGADGDIVPLYDADTEQEALSDRSPSADSLQYQTAEGVLVTHFSGRVRRLHPRNDTDAGQLYQQYNPFYFQHRNYEVEIRDHVAAGLDAIELIVYPQTTFENNDAGVFFRGYYAFDDYFEKPKMLADDGTDRCDGACSVTLTQYHDHDNEEGIPLSQAHGELMEIEFRFFLEREGGNGASPIVDDGGFAYYSRTWLYEIGEGKLHPWYGTREDNPGGVDHADRLDSHPIPEELRLGGDTTFSYDYSDETDQLFMQMALNISPRSAPEFLQGRRLTRTDFVDGAHAEDGNPDFGEHVGRVGPLFNQSRCIDCHVNNSRSPGTWAYADNEALGSLDTMGLVVANENGGPDLEFGNLLQVHATEGEAEGDVVVDHMEATPGVTLSSGRTVTLRSPRYSIVGADGLARDPAHFSPRVAPQFVGLGLLEAIPESTIMQFAENSETGRINVVEDPETDEPRLGRFGWRAEAVSIRHQIARALNVDMSIATSFEPELECALTQDVAACSDPESAGNFLGDAALDEIDRYMALLAVPSQRTGLHDPDLTEDARAELQDQLKLGGQIFRGQAQCAACHIADEIETTPHHKFPELGGQTIRPYTDMLLHNMGPDLADARRPDDSDVETQEWRTPPLWGIGLVQAINPDAGFMHDGRAQTLEEAILWHGGAAQVSRDVYQLELTEEEREALLLFLESL